MENKPLAQLWHVSWAHSSAVEVGEFSSAPQAGYQSVLRVPCAFLSHRRQE